MTRMMVQIETRIPVSLTSSSPRRSFVTIDARRVYVEDPQKTSISPISLHPCFHSTDPHKYTYDSTNYLESYLRHRDLHSTPHWVRTKTYLQCICALCVVRMCICIFESLISFLDSILSVSKKIRFFGFSSLFYFFFAAHQTSSFRRIVSWADRVRFRADISLRRRLCKKKSRRLWDWTL